MNRRTLLASLCVLILSGCGDGQTPPAGTSGAAAAGTATGTDTASAPPRTLIVDSKPGADYTSVTQAAREAGPQDTIKVRPGTYLGNTIVLSKSMSLIGDGKANEIIIQCDKASAVIADAVDIRISNVTLISNATQPALMVRIGKFSLQDCTVTCKNGTAVFLGGLVDATLTHNLLTGSKMGLESVGNLTAEKNMFSENETGLTVYGKSCTFKDNRVARSADDGLVIRPFVTAPVFEANEIFLNKGSGIVALGKVEPIIRKNKIHNNNYSGVSFDQDSGGVCEENEIQHCHIAVRAVACGKPTLRKNNLHDNYCGVFADKKGSAIVDGNDICNSEACGVYSETGGDLQVTHNTIHDNGSNGCGVIASMTIEDNDIYNNEQPGILVQDGAECQARRNTIHDQVYWGISTYGKGLIEDNVIQNNGSYGVMVRPKSTLVFRKNRISGHTANAVYVCKGGGGTFDENDLTGNYFGPWAFEAPALSLVRTKNKLDDSALSRSKVGDWVETARTVSGRKLRTGRHRLTLVSKDESEAHCEHKLWTSENAEPEITDDVEPIGAQHSFLNEVIQHANGAATHKEISHGEESLTIAGKTLATTWTCYEIVNDDAKPGTPPAKLKVWTSRELPIDETVKAVLTLPTNTRVEEVVVAFGDATTPKPDAPVSRPDPSSPPPPPDAPLAKSPPPAVKPTPVAPVAPPVADAPKPKASKFSLIHCKDGRQIRASLVMLTGDQYSYKDEDGQFQTLNKDDVTDVTKE